MVSGRVRVGIVAAIAVITTSCVALGVAPQVLAAGPTMLSGVVTDAVTGTALSGVEVDVVVGSSFEPGASVIASAMTDEAGAYSVVLAGLASAADRVTVDLIDQNEAYGVSYANEVSLVDDDTVFAPFSLSPGATVSGTVTAGGAVAVGSCVTVRNQATALVVPPDSVGSCTDVTGQYALPTLAAGTYTLTFSSPDTAQWNSIPARQITVVAGTPSTIDVSLPPVTATAITGTVTELGTGTPLAGVDVTATATDADGNPQTLTASTDGAGAFTLPITFAIGHNPSSSTWSTRPALTTLRPASRSSSRRGTRRPSASRSNQSLSPRPSTCRSTAPLRQHHRGEPSTIPFTVRNAGPTAASDVVVRINVPSSVSLVGVDAPSGFVCTSAELTVTCTASSLGVQRQAVVGIRVSGQDLFGFAFFTADVTTTSNDADPNDNTASSFGFVQADHADVAAFLDPGAIQVGITTPIAFGVANNGPAVAPDVFATLDLPPNFVIDHIVSPGWSCVAEGQTIGCSAVSLDAGSSFTAQAFVTAPSLATGLPIRAGAEPRSSIRS